MQEEQSAAYGIILGAAEALYPYPSHPPSPHEAAAGGSGSRMHGGGRWGGEGGCALSFSITTYKRTNKLICNKFLSLKRNLRGTKHPLVILLRMQLGVTLHTAKICFR